MSFIGVQMARHKGAGGSIAEMEDKAVTVRPSSSANFYVDSLDKLTGSSGDFLINKNQALFNGFFNRIAVGEVVVDWGIPNVAAWWGNNTISVTNASGGVINATLPDGFYTSIQCLQQVASRINTAAIAAGNALRLSVEFDGLDVYLNSTGVGTDAFYFNWTDGTSPPYSLARQLFTSAQLVGPAVQNTKIICSSPRVLGTTYIDIVSDQLTYNQDLKDATTDSMNRDVLYRWYFANDNVPQVLEQYPFELAAGVAAPAAWLMFQTNLPILQGYTAFVSRRALPVPKQIRWDPTAPIGQVGFQVYDDRGRLVDTRNFPVRVAPDPLANGIGGANFQFQMSMLLSEN